MYYERVCRTMLTFNDMAGIMALNVYCMDNSFLMLFLFSSSFHCVTCWLG